MELLGYLRANGCIAYAGEDQETIEVLLLQPSAHDGGVIMALVDAWRARRARAERPGAG
jgi:hypothetical protein